MKRLALLPIVIISIIIGLIIGLYFGFKLSESSILPISKFSLRPNIPKFDKYYIENLNQTQAGKFEILNELGQEDNYNSYLFKLRFNAAINSGEINHTTGLINIPNGEGEFPIILMARGYVDQQIYKTGIGTNRAGQVFAENGYITIAPDFLGYAGSSSESGNIFETRFQTYTTFVSLLKSIDQVEKWDRKNIFIWGHSNGGQISLTTLAATGREIPTVLWAPVTKPFPYNILYFTDESADGGELIRTELAKIEKYYKLSHLTFTNYLDKIKAPIILHQGTADDAVPLTWSQEFVANAQSAGIEIELIVYPNTDHNLMPHWDDAVERDLDFFSEHIYD